MTAFPEKRYDIIYADPPWAYGDKMRGHGFSIEPHYDTQDKDWIARQRPPGWDVWGNGVAYIGSKTRALLAKNQI